jgi:stearoyl-CoA desaturase (Delta-9 desaturase)
MPMKIYFLFTTQHVYPWDYKVSELPRYWCNFSIPFLDFFAWLGWATDLKTVSDEMIRKRVLRTGDGTHRYAKEKITAKELVDTFNNNNNGETDEHVDTLWGWGKIHLAFSSTRN